MGKIRVKTLGVEDLEKDEKKKAKARADAKKADATKKKVEATNEVRNENPEAASQNTPSESKPELSVKAEPEKRQEKKQQGKKKTESKQKHSKKFLTLAALVDRNKKYSLSEALTILPKLKIAKFDETVELHLNTIDKGLSGSIILPHGTGKKLRIEIVNQSEDIKHLEDVVKKIEAGQIDFDVLIATPDSMAKLARVARALGPRGLMPNPKNGTVTPKPLEAAKKYEGGQLYFKTEAKFPIMHLSVGKLSFEEKKLSENIKSVIQAVQTKNIKELTLKSTMSPGLKLDVSSL